MNLMNLFFLLSTKKINDEYELEKVDDYILKNPLFNERKYQFITEDEKSTS